MLLLTFFFPMMPQDHCTWTSVYPPATFVPQGVVWFIEKEGAMSKEKLLVYVVCLAVAAAGAFVGTSRIVGGIVADEVRAFEASLASLDHVQVNRLAYERRLFDGSLDYALVLRVLPGDPYYAELRDILGSVLDQGLRIKGRLDVKHGP